MAEHAFTSTVVVTLTPVTCCQCGMAFGISSKWNYQRQEDHGSFFCPAGHSQHWTGKTEAQRLKDQLDCEQRETARLRGERDRKDRQLSAARGRITKIKNRVGRGVCPCCNRTFVNLGRHMQGQHPGFTDQDVGP